jgi:L-threonylcarbamoyladenylate synthase
MPERLAVDPVHPDPAVLRRAADALRAGHVIAYPTDTLYGLAVDPRNQSAVERLFAIKGRAAGQALPLIAGTTAHVARVARMTPVAARLARTWWPGPLTLVLPAIDRLARGVAADDGTVAIRIPAHAVARTLAETFGSVITATSANRSGAAPTNDPAAVIAAMGGDLFMLVDSGMTAGGPPSTIVDASATSVRLVREGAVAWDRVLESLR